MPVLVAPLTTVTVFARLLVKKALPVVVLTTTPPPPFSPPSPMGRKARRLRPLVVA